MCRLGAEYANASASATPQAANTVPILEVDDIEMRRRGASYTIDTRALKSQGIDPVHWLVGADMLMYLPKWHRAQELLREVKFVVMARPGVTIDWDALPAEFRHLKSHVVEAPTGANQRDGDPAARETRGADRPTHSPAVAQYIEQRRLYRA